MAFFEALPLLERPLRLGVLGAARVVPKALKAAFSEPDFPVQVHAIAARELARAQLIADEFGIPRVYDSYLELISDPDIDAVYVALPCSFHAVFTQQAVLSGKHVLCEKPFSLNLNEAQSILECAEANARLVVEAHHWRYHPLLPEVARLIAQLGPLVHMRAKFHVGIDEQNDIRKDPHLGAGVTMDFGCYVVQWLCWAARAGDATSMNDNLDARVKGARMIEQSYGVDVALDAELLISGIECEASCDMQKGVPFSARLIVDGAYGRVHFENPLGTDGSWVQFEPNAAGIAQNCSQTRLSSPTTTTTYREQLVAFHQALCNGTMPPTSGQSIIETQALLDEMYRVAGLISRSELKRWAQARGEQ